ncbi:fatty acid-binding protein, muscle-like isoform X2 [Schistocerca gregaria]|uniref:fatty acid-binding protein, muscle-like isoform X2 n=1 Tax=Schistocerca gregaria TaxID=7010 RepID=UPI00211E3ECF|nr:fatty acid-binding protein, muscle-like isoform X2 [Schistocerca gregaria]
MVQQFSGRSYELDVASMENMEAFLNASGVTDPTHRQMALSAKDTLTLTLEGDKVTDVTQLGEYKHVLTYRLGEEFTEDTAGRKRKSTVTQRGADTLVKVEKYEDGKTVTIEKTFSADKMVATLSVGSVTAKRIYKAV